jgi:hypothetical protein
MAKVVSTPWIKETNVLICDCVSRLTLNGHTYPVKAMEGALPYSQLSQIDD